MGNCLFGGEGGGGGGEERLIQVVTFNGGIMEFHPPITAGCILSEFSGHAVYQGSSDDPGAVESLWKPLQPHEELHPGKTYHLLPWSIPPLAGSGGSRGHVRSKSIPMMTGDNNVPVVMPVFAARAAATPAAAAPYNYRMSLECDSHVLKRSYTEVLCRRRRQCKQGGEKTRDQRGVWKVKLVISPEQLSDILSQEALTQELIENVRTVAKSRGVSSSSTVGTADQLSSTVSENSIESSTF